MSRPQSPRSNPRDLPLPTEEDLDFEEPPPYLKNHIIRTFWCINKNVREKILENRPKVVFFCFHKGFCTFQVDHDPNTARERIATMSGNIQPPHLTTTPSSMGKT